MKDYAKYSNAQRPRFFYKFILILCILVSLGGLIYLGKDFIKSSKSAKLFSSNAITKKIEAIKKGEVKIPAKKEKVGPPPSPPEKPKNINKTQFDFYTLLPQMKMSSTVARNPALQNTKPNNEYFVLQIAAVQNQAAATELIADLNSLGITAHTQSVQENGKTWIRIISQPYSSFQAAQDAQDKLHQHHIASLLVKTKD